MNPKPETRLIVRPGVREQISAALLAAYPHEGCGVLIGTRDGATLKIHQAAPLPNVELTRGHDRFTIDPAAYARLERELATRPEKCEVVGYFHSHPDAPALPSPVDLDAAKGLFAFTRTAYVYAIMSVENKNPSALRWWFLRENCFVEVVAVASSQ